MTIKDSNVMHDFSGSVVSIQSSDRERPNSNRPKLNINESLNLKDSTIIKQRSDDKEILTIKSKLSKKASSSAVSIKYSDPNDDSM